MKKMIWQNFFNARAIIFFIVLGFFLAILQFSTPALVDPDGYYHIKAAEIISEQGFSALIRFPHLTQSIWQIYNADLSLGFHLILLPFVSVFGGLIGIKILSILSSLLVLAAFWLGLRALRVPYAFWWTGFLFAASSIFLFRLTLPRGLLFAISLLLASFIFLSLKRYLWLWIAIFVYSWVHASAPLILIFGILFFSIRLVIEKKPDWRALLIPFFGYFAGLVLRPDFPDNIRLLFVQNLGPFIERMQGLKLDWAAELSAPSLLNVASDSFLIMVAWLVGMMLIFKKTPQRKVTNYDVAIYSSGLISFMFFLMMLASHRFVDFFTPFAVLFVAMASRLWSEKIDIKNFFQIWLKKHRTLFISVFLFVALLVSKNFFGALASVKAVEPLEKFQAASLWLNDNTPGNSVIFHTDWDDFPKLFFYNDRNRYLIGLDPTFMYVYDKNSYWLWRNISDYGIARDRPLLAEKKENYQKYQYSKIVAQTIQGNFNSNIIFVPQERTVLKEFLGQDSQYFEKAYEDKWAAIFLIK